MPSTYTPIATTTLGSSAATITLNSIPSTYTDLVMVFRGNNDAGANRAGYIRFNSDSGTNYSYTLVQGDGSSAGSGRDSNIAQSFFANVLGDNTMAIVQVMNYANTTTNKTFLSRGSSASTVAQAIVGLWRSTSAINTITLSLNASNYASGTTVTLYGVKSA